MIDFGVWLDQHKVSLNEDTYGLFKDSYNCLKYEIIRPAFILAYQGLMWHIRHIVLSSEIKPNGYKDEEWEKRVKANLRNDDKWDEETFTCTQALGNQNGKDAILSIPKEVREKFPFWRQIRNVSAHYKGYELHEAHVLALYSFIEQYLETITIEGSAISLSQKFDDFLNPNITSPNEDIQPLIDKVDAMISNEEMPSFLGSIIKSCRKHIPAYDKIKELSIINAMIHKCPSRISECVINYVENDKDLFKSYIEKHPDDILRFLKGNQRVYQFWHNELTSYRCKIKLLAILFTADLINSNDSIDAIKLCLKAAESEKVLTDYNQLSALNRQTLYERGYFKEFFNAYFNSKNTLSNYKDICYNTNFYIGTISIIPKIDKEYVEALIDIFSKQYYPFTLRDRLKDIYYNDQKYREEIDDICTKESLELPDCLL